MSFVRRALGFVLAVALAAGLARVALASRPLDSCSDRCDSPRPVGARVSSPPVAPVASPVVGTTPAKTPAPAPPAAPSRNGHKATPVVRAPQPRARGSAKHPPATPCMQLLLQFTTGAGSELSYVLPPAIDDHRSLEGRGPPGLTSTRDLPAPSRANAREPAGPASRASRPESSAAPLALENPNDSPPAVRVTRAAVDGNLFPDPLPSGLRAHRPEGAAARTPTPSGGVPR